MATLRELLVTIETKLNEPAMKEAQRRIDNELSKAEKKFNRVYKQVLKEQAVALKEIQDKQIRAMKSLRDNADKLGGVLKNVYIGFVGSVLVATTAIIKLNDSLNTNIARIGVLSGNMATAKDRFKEIIQVSNQTGQSVDSLSSLYGKITMNAREFGASNADQIKALSTVAKLAMIGGTSIVAQQGGLIQLGQALGSATVQADEYRSIVEGLPALNNAIAKTMGKTGPQLQAFIKNTKTTGGITGKELFQAILKATKETDERFIKLPLTFQRVQNQGVNAFLELGLAIKDELAPVDTFINYLSTLVVRFKDYIIANKELVGLNIKQLFEGLTNSINFAIEAYKTFEPLTKLLISNFSTIISLSGGVLAGYVALKLFLLAQMIPTAIQTGIAMAAALGPVGLAITGIIALATFLELKFQLLSKAIKGIGDAWNAVSGKFSQAGVSFSGALERASRGEIRGGGREKRRLQSEAQRQGAGNTVNNGNKTLTHYSKTIINGVPNQQQAVNIGKNVQRGGLVLLNNH